MPKKLINYFNSNICIRIKTNKKGLDVYTRVPTLNGFAQTINVTARTLRDWAANHEKFALAKSAALEIQRDCFSNIVCLSDFNWEGGMKYDAEFPALLIDHTLEIFVNHPNKLPTVESFAVKIGASRQALYRWSDKHPEFKTAMEFCKTLQHGWLLESISSGKIPNSMTIFLLKCIHGMKEDEPESEKNTVYTKLSFNDVIGVHRKEIDD